MTTMEDAAKRLHARHKETLDRLRVSAVTGTRYVAPGWEKLSPEQQEAWLSVAHEAVKIGVELQREIARTSHGLDGEDLPDEAPKLTEIANRPQRFTRVNVQRCEAECAVHRVHMHDGTPVPGRDEEHLRCPKNKYTTSWRCILFDGHEGDCK